MTHALHIHSHEYFPKQGGVGRYCREFALASGRLGWRVTLHGPRPAARPPGDPAETAGGYALDCGRHGRSHRPLNLWLSRERLAGILKRSPTARHLLAEPGPILAYGLLPEAKGHAARVRLVLHGSEIERWATWPWGSGRIARRALKRAEAVLVPSRPVRDRLLEAFPEAKGQVLVVPHALPEGFRAAATQHTATARHEANTRSALHLLSVGRIHPRKGFDQILQALAHLAPRDKQAIRLTIAGARSDEGYRRQLQAAASSCGCRVDWRLDPDDAELATLYRSADLFALTSLPRRHSVEGFGLVYLEAAAFGLPSLAYQTGGVGDAVSHGVTGHLLPPGEPMQLAESLRFFLRNPEARCEMGARARSQALSRTWENVVRESLD